MALEWRLDNARLKEAANTIFRAGLEAVDPARAVAGAIHRQGNRLRVSGVDGATTTIQLSETGRILAVGAGKAAAPMAVALEACLGDRLAGGLVSVKDGHGLPTRVIEIVEAGHPVPDLRGQTAAQRILELVSGLTVNDLVIALFSGGGSALIPCPAPALSPAAPETSISLEDKQRLTSDLLGAGADIGEINCVRKHISGIKGGLLARHCRPARVISLLLSDVIGDRLEVIASGPTVPDPTTFVQAVEVLRKRGLWLQAPASVRRRLERVAGGGQTFETPGPGDPVFARVDNFLVATSSSCVEGCVMAARKMGFRTVQVIGTALHGEARDVGARLAAGALEFGSCATRDELPACFVAGGETTVTLRGKGRGGRNQELALAAALELTGAQGVAVFSAGTDGTDGPTPAAGAMAFGDSLQRGCEAGFDAARCLADNDSHPYFEALGDLVSTGPTRTNVMDIQIILVS